MTDRELFQKTFSYLHASDDTLSEVYKVIHDPHTRKHTARRAGRIAVIAAVFILLLTITAVAVYQYTVKDAVMEAVPSVAFRGARGLVIEQETRLSHNGFADSPEYQAYMEWENYLAQWEVDNPNIYEERGMDDAEYETAENYARLYGACFPEQAEKLDEIMEKYGLTVHTSREFFYTERQLCRALGIDDILSDVYDAGGEYFYDDGSFRLDAELTVDGKAFWMTCVNAVKGSITMISGGMPDKYEEWTYTTAAGREVIMLSCDGGAVMIADLGGSYVTVSIQPWHPPYGAEVSLTREQARELVEGINLEALADCFASEGSRQAVAASIADFVENKDSTTTTDNMDDGAAIVLDILGNYYLSALPEGYSLRRTDYDLPDTAAELGYYSVSHHYEGEPAGIGLSYRSLKKGETAPAFTDPTELERQGMAETPCTVNGCEAIVTEYNQGTEDRFYFIQWLDKERELVFSVHTGGSYTAEEILALAESVTAEDPALETGSAAYAARAARHQEEIDALSDQSWAEYEAYMEEEEAAVQAALAKLGDYNITALPEGYSYISSSTTSVTEIPSDAGYSDIIGYRMDLTKKYQGESEDKGLHMRYWRCWDAENESVSLNQRQFGRMREAYEKNLEGEPASVASCPNINGCEAFLRTTTIRTAGSSIDMVVQEIYWLDTKEDMIFSISGWAYTDQADTLTTDDLIAIAGTVAER